MAPLLRREGVLLSVLRPVEVLTSSRPPSPWLQLLLMFGDLPAGRTALLLRSETSQTHSFFFSAMCTLPLSSSSAERTYSPAAAAAVGMATADARQGPGAGSGPCSDDPCGSGSPPSGSAGTPARSGGTGAPPAGQPRSTWHTNRSERSLKKENGFA